MRIKVKSREQIEEDMSHTNIDDLIAYASGLPDHILTLICGQWFDVIERRASRRWSQHKGSVIESPTGSGHWFVIDYLVDEIEED